MKVTCSAVHMAVGTVGTGAVTGPVASHVERCDACERELVEIHRVEEAMASLSHETHEAPAHLHTAVMSSLGPVAVPDLDPRSSFAVPVAAAAFVATAAAGTAVLIRLRRQSAA